MSKRYITTPIDKPITIQGTVFLSLKAALKSGNASTDFDPVNVNDVDTLTMKLGNSQESGRMDDVEIDVLLCDISDKSFNSIQSSDPERNIIPTKVVKEGAIINGSNIPAFDESEFETVNKKYRVITRAFADLCNPEAGFEPRHQPTAKLVVGEYHDTELFEFTRYTLEPGIVCSSNCNRGPIMARSKNISMNNYFNASSQKLQLTLHIIQLKPLEAKHYFLKKRAHIFG